MIYILLPAYNEGMGIAALLKDIDSVMRRESLSYQSVVVDDGSSDNTGSVVSSLRGVYSIELIKHPVNKDLGEALKTGFNYLKVKTSADDIVFIMDADNTHPPDLMPEMIKKINSGCDLVIASRYQAGAKVYGVPLYRRMLSRAASIIFMTLMPIKGVKDYTGGFRAYRASLIKKAFDFYNGNFVTEKGFSCMIDILIKLSKLKPSCAEIPLSLYYNKKQGPSKMKIYKSIKATLRLLYNYRFK